MLTTAHTDLSKLPESCANRGIESYMAQRVATARSSDGGMRIAGDLDLRLVNNLYREDQTFTELKPAPLSPTSREAGMDEALLDKAFFERGVDGSMTVSQSWQLQDGRTFTLRGERISPVVVMCAW